MAIYQLTTHAQKGDCLVGGPCTLGHPDRTLTSREPCPSTRTRCVRLVRNSCNGFS